MKKTLTVIILLVSAILIVGCSTKETAQTPTTPTTEGQTEQTAPDTQDLQTSDDDFEAIDSALETLS